MDALWYDFLQFRKFFQSRSSLPSPSVILHCFCSYLQYSLLDRCQWHRSKFSKYIVYFISMTCYSLFSLPPILAIRLMVMLLNMFPPTSVNTVSTFRIVLCANSGESRKGHLVSFYHMSNDTSLHPLQIEVPTIAISHPSLFLLLPSILTAR